MLNAALDLMDSGGCKVIAGGTDVFPSMRQGSGARDYLDLTRIAALRGIVFGKGETVIGAATTWSDLVRAELPPAFDALRQAARDVGSLQIQNAGTIGGNLCNASPAADGVPPLLVMDAAIQVASAARGVRRLPLAEFLLGVRKTALASDELLTAIVVPDAPDGARSAFLKLGARRYMVISIAMTAVLIRCDSAGRIVSARAAVGSCSPVAQRLPELEAAVTGLRPDEVVVDPAHLSALSPIDDLRGTAGYRADVVAEQCARAIRKAAGHE